MAGNPQNFCRTMSQAKYANPKDLGSPEKWQEFMTDLVDSYEADIIVFQREGEERVPRGFVR